MDKADEEKNTENLLSALSAFKCDKDNDIETFLHTKAIEYINRKWCSVYLILNEELFLKNMLKIEAYFTLSHKTLSVTENISKSKVQKIGGFKTLTSLHFVLIGQLGKHIDSCYCSKITAKEILDKAFSVIYESSSLIPCKCVLVETGEEEKVQKVYKDYNFSYFQFDGKHHQYYKLLD